MICQLPVLRSQYLNLLLCVLSLVVGSSIAKEKPDCDCFEVKFEPSRERIKITHSPVVKQVLQAAAANKPTEAELLKKIVATADTFVQRHMNGEIYQDQDPDGWDAYNGSIMTMPLDAWMRMQSERGDKDGSRWSLCPAAKLVSLGYKPNSTSIHYELTTVGRFTRNRSGVDPFSDVESGNVFSLDVTINDQAKIVDLHQTPAGRWSYAYTTAVQALRQNLRRKGMSPSSAADIELLAKHKRIWTQQLSGLQRAAKVCTPTKHQGK